MYLIRSNSVFQSVWFKNRLGTIGLRNRRLILNFMWNDYLVHVTVTVVVGSLYILNCVWCLFWGSDIKKIYTLLFLVWSLVWYTGIIVRLVCLLNCLVLIYLKHIYIIIWFCGRINWFCDCVSVSFNAVDVC